MPKHNDGHLTSFDNIYRDALVLASSNKFEEIIAQMLGIEQPPPINDLNDIVEFFSPRISAAFAVVIKTRANCFDIAKDAGALRSSG